MAGREVALAEDRLFDVRCGYVDVREWIGGGHDARRQIRRPERGARLRAHNAVYWWTAKRILERRLPGERPADSAGYAAAVRIEAPAAPPPRP